MARWCSPHLVPSDPGVPHEGLNDGAEVPQLLRVLHQLAAGVLVQLETRQVEKRGGHPVERIWFCPKKKTFSYSNIRYSLVDILLDLHHLLPGPVQEEAQGAAGLAVLSCNDEFRKIWAYCVVLFPVFLTVLPVRHAPGDHADEVVLQRGGQHGAPLLGHRREQGAAVLGKQHLTKWISSTRK